MKNSGWIAYENLLVHISNIRVIGMTIALNSE